MNLYEFKKIDWGKTRPAGRVGVSVSVLVDLHSLYLIFYRTLQYVINSLLQRDKTIDDQKNKNKKTKKIFVP